MPVRKKESPKVGAITKRERQTLVRSNGVEVKHATSRSTWKQFERAVASFFGTRRTPLSGSNSGHNTNSDTLHEDFYIECKFRNKFSIFALFKDTEVKAKVEGKIPIVAIKQKGENGFLLVVRPKDLEKIVLKNGSKHGKIEDSTL